MINRLGRMVSLGLVIVLTSLGVAAQAPTAQGGRSRREEARFLVTRIDNRASVFRKSLDETLDRSKWDGTRAEDNINQLVKDFDSARESLRVSLNDRDERPRESTDEVQEVLRRAVLIDNFFVTRRVRGDVQDKWIALRGEVDRLAQHFKLTAGWNTGSNNNTSGQYSGEVRQLIQRIETRTDSFRDSLTDSLDRSRIDGTRREDNINMIVQEFEAATDRLRDRNNVNSSDAKADAQEVLQHGARIDRFMTRFSVGGRAGNEWRTLRQDLDQLALAFSVSPTWGSGGYTGGNNGGGSGGNYGANRLTGTFRLDRSQSEDARTAAERATRNLPSNDRQYVYDRLVNRLESPDQIAIERNGNNVTIASTRASQITFEANGREQEEQTPGGRTVRVTATLNRDQLMVTTTGNRDTDFTVTFDPIDDGRRLRVTRRLSSDRLNTTVEVQSVYDRTSNVAQWSVYSGSSYPTTGSSTNNDFIIPNNTQLVAVLNTNLSTSQSRDGDRFTMTVRDPRMYDGATIEGYISNLDRGGRVSGRSEMTLNFERIRMRDGRTYSFSGLVQSVRTPNGETISVNNEGSVRDDNRTSTTATRTAVGTAVGALIGAIAGGGKGAVIGAAVGAGAGAGSVYVQGRDDLNLTSGSEVAILATGPR